MSLVQCVAAVLLLEQALPIDPAASLAEQLSRLGLNVCLIVTVGVLWRSLTKKDEQMVSIVKQMADALATNSDTQRELRKVVEEKHEVEVRLAAAIESGMLRLPCQLPIEEQKKRGIVSGD